MEISEELVGAIKDAILSKFERSNVQSVRIISFEVDEDSDKIRIIVEIETHADPKMLAESYFGLTNTVRKLLGGSEWSNFFPVITPKIGDTAHA